MGTYQRVVLAFITADGATVHTRCATDHPVLLRPVYSDTEQATFKYCDECRGVLPLSFLPSTFAEVKGYAEAGSTHYRDLLDTWADEVAQCARYAD